MAETATVETNVAATGDESVRVYEVGYHIIPTKKENELEPTVGKIRTLIEKAGGKFLAEGAPSLQRLSYLMSTQENGRRADHDRGYFGWIKFEAPAEAAKQLERSLSGMQDILRSVLFKTVREETRARFRPSIREVRRSETLRTAPRKEEVSAPVSEEELDKAIEDITAE